MTYREKKYISQNEDNIIRTCSMSIILLIVMSEIFFLYMANLGCFTFIIHHFLNT